jgi:hypothetical protein
MTASSTIYAGGLVCVDTNGTAVAAADTSGYLFVGIADEQVTSAASGNYYIRVRNGDVTLPATSIAQGHVGDIMYVVDDNEFDDSAGVINNVVCGVLVRYISATEGIVDTTSTAVVSTVATSVTFADGATLVHEAALTATEVDGALEELHAEFDDHICENGAGVTTTSPGTNREHFAGSISGFGSGISYAITDDGSGIAAMAVCRCNGYTTGLPDVVQSTNATGSAPASFYCPTAIAASATGWGYKVYTQLNSGVNTGAASAMDPVYRSATGTLTLTRTTGALQCQVVGRVLTVAADGEVQIDFDDWQFPEHSHNDESEGGEFGLTVPLTSCAAWTKNGTDQTVLIPAIEFPYAVTINRAYVCLGTAPDKAAGLILKLNTNALLTVAQAATTGEAESLSIAIAANTDFALTANEEAGGLGADLRVHLYGVKTAV